MIEQAVSENTVILGRFKRLVGNGRLAHAYLFVGPDGIGKTRTALAVAKMIICEDKSADGTDGFCGFCGRCGACLKIDAGSHPDVTVIAAGEEETITIERVRDMIGRLQLRPYEAEKKIFIIEKIEDLTLQGSNALLKTLEEPSKDSLLILTTAVLEKNLATIRSRCHVVHFFPQGKKVMTEVFGRAGEREPGAARFLTAFSEGYPARAQTWYDQGLFQRKNDILDRLVLKKADEAFLKRVLADKGQTREVLHVLFSWFRDILLLRAGSGEGPLMHADRLPELTRGAKVYTFRRLREIIDEIVHTERLLNENFNVKIPIRILLSFVHSK